MIHDKYLLVIPVFNEADCVSRVLRRARRHLPNILVINDGSTDRTTAVLAREGGVCLIEHRENLGYGRSLADAFAFAAGRGYEWLITMDCDEQHEPSFLPHFVAAAGENNADIISGSRYLQRFDGNGNPPADRRAINHIMTALLNERLSLRLTDAFCGFKAYRVSTLSRLHITEPGYAMPLQFWVQAARAGLRIVELPVRLIYNDPNRHFGGQLDDPQVRLRYYLAVLERELADRRIRAYPGSFMNAETQRTQSLAT